MMRDLGLVAVLVVEDGGAYWLLEVSAVGDESAVEILLPAAYLMRCWLHLTGPLCCGFVVVSLSMVRRRPNSIALWFCDFCERIGL